MPLVVCLFAAPTLHLRQNLFEEHSVGPRIGRRLFGGRADLAALDHDRSVEAGGLQRGEDRREVDLSRAELDHHVALERRAILGAEAGDVLRDRLQLFNRVLAGVVDDVAGVVPDLEVRVLDGFHRRHDFRRCAAAAAVRLHHQLDPALLRVRRRIAHHLVVVLVFFRLVDAEREQEGQRERRRHSRSAAELP